MKIVLTIKAWNRPDYFAEVMDGLDKCLQRVGVSIPTLISFDAAPMDVTNKMVECVKSHPSIAQSCMLFKNENTAGCAGNTFLLLNRAFNEEDADYVIHLEDDTVPAGDFLEWMLWAYSELEKNPLYFAACPFNRAAVADTVPPGGLGDAYHKAWFECGGGFGIPRRTWNFIESKGGMFGAVGRTNSHDLVGHEWKQSIHQTWKGSWAWPFNQFFRERSETEHLCIFPTFSRTQNIGCENGLFNPSAAWHEQNIKSNDWVGNMELPEDLVYSLDTSTIVLPNV